MPTRGRRQKVTDEDVFVAAQRAMRRRGPHELTLADIAVVSPLLTMGHADCSVDDGAHPKSAADVAAIAARPSFARLIAKEKAFLAA